MDSPANSQPTLWDAANSAADGMARAAAGADPAWMEAAWLTLLEYLRSHERFFVDDLWAETDLERPREPRALGPIIAKAQRAGLIVKTGDYRPSVSSNLSAKPVWLSTIFIEVNHDSH